MRNLDLDSSHGLQAAMVLCGCLTLGLSCTKMPPAQAPVRSGPKDVAVAEPEPSASPEGCGADDLKRCTSACNTSACLDWCGGTACVEVAAEMHACVAPAEKAFRAKHPEPELEYLPAGPEADEEMAYEQVDPDSDARYTRWVEAEEDAAQRHWEASCDDRCRVAFREVDAQSAEDACEYARNSAGSWTAFVPPKPKKPKKPETSGTKSQRERDREIAENAGILGALMGGGALGGAFGGGFGYGGSRLTVEGDSTREFEHGFALRQLVEKSAVMNGAEDCVPELGEEGAKVRFALSFEADGGVASVKPVGPAKAGLPELNATAAACVAEIVERTVNLPPLATRGVPELHVEVLVRTPVDMGFGTGFGELMGSDAGGGEAWGAGGLGVSGQGAGGGGTAEGIGGIGGIGTTGRGGGGAGYGSVDMQTGSGKAKSESKPAPKPAPKP